MKIFDIYRLEHNNKDACYLIKDGLFWKAWERSAMLFQRYVKSYEITTRYFKGINTTMVYLGFPNQYLTKIKDNCIAEGFDFLSIGGKIEISGFNDVDGFSEWKETITEKLSLASESQPSYVSEKKRLDEYRCFKEEIIKFPLAVKTPFECQQFIYELQQKLNGTI
jgi:hypothetical protein